METTIYTSQDTFIRATEANDIDNEAYIVLGKTESSDQVDRILLGFDLSAVAGKTIDAAVLHLYQDYSSYATATTLPFYAHCISESWSAGEVSWNDAPAYTETAAAALSLSGNADGPRSFDVTGLVQDIVHNARPCTGILLKQANEETDNLRKQFFSENYDSGSRKAYLVITYHDMNVWVKSNEQMPRVSQMHVYSGGQWKQCLPGSAVYSGSAWKSFM